MSASTLHPAEAGGRISEAPSAIGAADDASLIRPTKAAVWWIALAGTGVILLAPLLLVDVPPLLDYPNHLARMYVLAFGAQDPVLSHMYQPHWTIIPNLAIDLILPHLMQVLPVYLAGRIMLGLTLLLPLAGVVVYHRVAFGTRSYWPIAAALMAYNALFILGFMNFLMSVGLALLAAAGWRRWHARHPVWTSLAGALAAVAIFFMHLFGLAFLAILIGSETVVRLWRLRAGGRPIRPDLLRDAMTAAAVFAAPLALCLAAPLHDAAGPVIFRPLTQKPYALLEPFLAYDGRIDALVGGVILAGLYLAWRRHHLLVAPGIGLALVALLGLYLVSPFIAKQACFIDARFPIVLGLLLFAGLRPVALSGRARGIIGAGLVALFLGRMISLGTVWIDHNHDLAEFRRVVASVTPGSRVLVVSVTEQEAPRYWRARPRGLELPHVYPLDLHLPALLTIEHRAFFPYLFTVPGQHPLQPRPPYDALSVAEGAPPDWQSLADDHTPSAPYLADWQHQFDYVLLLDAGGAGDLHAYLPHHLTLLAASDIAALFRIRK